jgi:hypothetical protein
MNKQKARGDALSKNFECDSSLLSKFSNYNCDPKVFLETGSEQ